MNRSEPSPEKAMLKKDDTEDDASVAHQEDPVLADAGTGKQPSTSSTNRDTVVGSKDVVKRRSDSDADSEKETQETPTKPSEGEALVMGHRWAEVESMDVPDFVKQHSTTLTFPQKLMLMLMHIEKVSSKTAKKTGEDPLCWLDDGLSFCIRDKKELVSQWLPVFFRQAKFSSFTRKLYRWGFRQVNVGGPISQGGEQMFFGNENFQRDNKYLMANMRSVTAAGRRREEEAAQEERKMSEMGLSTPTISRELRQLLHSRVIAQNEGVANLSQVALPAGLLGLGGWGPQNELLQHAAARAQLQQRLVQQQYPLVPQDAAVTQQFWALARLAGQTGIPTVLPGFNPMIGTALHLQHAGLASDPGQLRAIMEVLSRANEPVGPPVAARTASQRPLPPPPPSPPSSP